jgi:hypothetical protein
MRALRILAITLAAAAAVPAGAAADAPWGPPTPISGVSAVTTLLATQIGGRVLVGAADGGSPAAPTVVARVHDDGSTTHRQTLPLAYAQAATFERAGVVVAGSRPAQTSAGAAKAPVVVALGSIRGIHDVGAPRALPGTGGMWVSAVAGNPAGGTVALVTAAMYTPGTTRELWVRRGRVFHRVLRFAAGTRARDAAVAVGPHGDVLVAWQGHRSVYARHLGRSGRPGAVHRLGPGVQSALQARVDDDGRLEVAWESQGVSEGFAQTPATVAYTSAPTGGRFAAARVVGRSSLTGTGRYVARPGVRLVATGPRSSALAWTAYDGRRFRVQVADVAGGRVGRPQTVSPAGDDAVLGDLASSAAGGQLVLWRTGTRGTDPSGPQRVAGAVRTPGAAAFAAPELISEPVGAPGPAAAATTVALAPSAAVDTRLGRSLAVWTTLDGQTKVAVRPPTG